MKAAVVVSFPQRAPTRSPKMHDFQYPEKCPTPESMIDDLSKDHDRRAFGILKIDTGNKYAAHAECEIFNNWVRLRALTLGMREPGALSVDQFVDRYWKGGA